MTTLTKKISGLSLIALLAFTPAFALADKKRGSSGEDHRSAVGTQASAAGLATATHKSEGRSNARHDDDDDDEDCVVMPSQATSSLLRIRKHDDDEHRCRVATTTPPVITAPALSGVAASVGTSTATVAFTTDVPAVGTLFYGTQNPFSFIKALGNPSELTSHAFSLAGLAANTTYFYVVLASNAIGTAVSNILTFTTSALADVTPPVVSNIAATSTATGSATLSWTTNELSTSKVFFGTTTPLNLLATTTPFVANSSLTTSHSITVPGLATTTTYHFVVSSSDAAGNTATSSDIQFLIP